MPTKKKSLNTGKVLIDSKKIVELYNKELALVKKLNDKKFNELEEKINSKEEVENENMLIEIIDGIIDNRRYEPTQKELEKIARIYVPDSKKSAHRCLNFYDKVEEIDKGFLKNYKVTKDGKKYYVKIESIKNYKKEFFEEFVKSKELMKKASDLGLSVKIHDMFICKDKDGAKKLFTVSEYVEGQSLVDYMDNNKLTEKHKKQIKDLINKLFDNGIILEFITARNILLLKNGKMIFTTLSEATSTENIIKNKKSLALEDMEWITAKSDKKVKSLVIKKLIMDKKISLN